jgi:hypothetical protein
MGSLFWYMIGFTVGMLLWRVLVLIDMARYDT